MLTPTNSVMLSIREFCGLEMDLKKEQESYRDKCENAVASRNGSYASISRAMQDDGVEVLELASGGYLRKTMSKSQTTLKPDLAEEAISNAILELNRAEEATPETFLDLVKKHIRSLRTTETPRITHITKLPRALQGADIPRANEYMTDTADSWLKSREFLSASREAHASRKKEIEQSREKCLANTGVREYIKRECVDGKPVRIEGHTDRFVLKFSDSCRRRPMREIHIQEAIEQVVSGVDISGTISAPEVAKMIMDAALEKAGTETVDAFSLSAKSGRKRAVDGSTK
jgi:hypothetical protein